MKSKKVIILLTVIIVGIASFLIYHNIQNRNENQLQTDIVDEKNDIRMEGYLYPTENGYGLMGWSLTGDNIDFKSYMDKRIVVVGQKGENPYEIVVSEIFEIEDDSEIKTRETVVYGVLKEYDISSSKDRHYKIGSFDIRTDQDLSEYVGKEVAVLVDEIVSPNMTLRHGNLIDINIPYVIQGTLETISKENRHYHYKLGEYDVHSTMDITRYEGDYLKLLVFDGQHGIKEKNKVTLVKVQ